TFKIHPPLEYDENLCHLNLKLASEHIPYKHVTIIIEDAEYVESVYPHPPSLKQVNAGDKIAYQGSVAE
ncbi:MAG: DUF2207 domain-containing protein, partial [Nitrososphaeria archaeon]|nr:DUF2207 domain-containing protein [Nitrososphaeria archaeon]